MQSFTVVSNLVDIPSRRICPAQIDVEAGVIKQIQAHKQTSDTFVLPGFVDAHVHIESSMLTPAHFAQAAVVHGTVATVSDPHEIANVLGVAGVEFMLQNAATVPFKFAFGAPSCVPATPFETAGAALSVDEVKKLLEDERIYYLSEVMNFPGVLNQDPDLLAMIQAAQKCNKPIDGHAPGLRGEQALAYHAAGISTDHECFTKDEALDKLQAGALIQIREGSAARNFAALFPLIDEFPGRVMLCSDDKHPDELIHGHIDALVRRSIAQGADLFHTLEAACITPVKHYQLPVGQLQVGDPADFIEVDSLTGFHIRRTFIDGQCVAESGESKIKVRATKVINQFSCTPKTSDQFAVAAPASEQSQNKPKMRVIEAIDGQLITHAQLVEPTIKDGQAVADPSKDLLKITVVNRYTNTPPAVGFVTGFGLKRGAMAGSVGHDSHNIVAVGTCDESICQAVNAVIETKGGLSAVDADDIRQLSLSIAGLISTLPCHKVAEEYEALDHLVKTMGSDLRAPYMTLSFMALLVIPNLKLSDQGLFDGQNFSLTDLWA